MEEVARRSDGRGVDLILDVAGAAYWQRNLRALADGGRLVLVGLLGGVKVEADLGPIVRRRLQVIGTAMRSRPLEDRVAITRNYRENLEPALVDGRLRPVIDRRLPPPRGGGGASLHGGQPQLRQDRAGGR